MRTNNKRGISLIVLVITIIVMIILAAAIILSISNSGVIDKANKAKKSSDVASLKEYVNVLESEYELKVDGTSAYSTKESYVNDKLYDNGYKDVALSVDGELYMGLKANARKAIVDGLAIGDKISGYNPSVASTTTSGKENTAKLKSGSTYEYEETNNQPQTVYRTEFSTWRFVGVSNNGEIEIAPDMFADAKGIDLSGKGGYLNGPTVLNEVCDELYTVAGKGKARSMNVDDIKQLLKYTGTGGMYWTSEDYFVRTESVLTIGQVIQKLGKDSLTYTETPDGKDINNYASVYYDFIENDSAFTANSLRKSLVFYENSVYYLASNSSIYLTDSSGNLVYFLIELVVPNGRDDIGLMFYSYGRYIRSQNEWYSSNY